MKYIILKMLKEADLERGELDCYDLIESNIEDDKPIIFNSLDEADDYRNENEVDGQIVEYPLY